MLLATSSDECRLPPELLDIVVDHLHDDPTTLRSLAITSTQCLHSSRVHLFYQIQLMHHPSAEYHQIPSRVLDKYYRLNKILDTSPRLRGYIRHLIIHRAEFSHWVWYHIEPVVVQILGKLNNVSILSLRRVDFAWLSHFVRSPLRSMMLGTVVHLELHSCRFHDFTEFFNLIAGSNFKQLGVKEPSGLSKKDKQLVASLEQLSGPQFDQEYIKAMVKDHKQDLKEFESEAKMSQDPNVKKAAEEGTNVISQHLQLIEQIAQSHNVAVDSKQK